MANAFDEAELLDFHRRLTDGDRVASAAFAGRFLSYLVEETARKFNRQYAHLAHDGAVDAFLDFCAHPERFNPSLQSSVEGCLLNAAWCNASNLIVSERRLKARERRAGSKIPEISVALDPAARKIRQEEDERRAADVEEILAALNERDREFYKLHLQGTRATAPFARILQIEHLPVEQQRKKVKQHKDRIRGFLKRKGLLP